jgi:ribosomal protein S18 acetylase RimI-like enzyme
MNVRPATSSDVPALHVLIESAYRGQSARRGWTHEADLLAGQRTDLAELHSIIGDSRQHLLIHEADGIVEGCITAAEKAGGLVYLGMVTVAPELQGAGLGRALLSAAETFAADKLGASRAEMTVIERRRELIAWYERRGYRRSGERRPFPRHDPRAGIPQCEDLDFVVLEKDLRSPSSEV